MNFKFIGETIELNKGIQILSKELNFQVTDDGVPIKVEKSLGDIEVIFENNRRTTISNKWS